MDKIFLKIKTTKGQNFDISVPITSTVEELKQLISLKSDIPAEDQKLVHSGRTLNDNWTIGDSKLTSGELVYLFKKIESQNDTSNNNNEYSNGNSSMFYQNPYEINDFPPCFGGSNFNGLDLDMFMNNPFVQSIFESTDFMDLIINSNPQIKRMVEEHPELGNAIRDPATIKQALEVMKNPSLMKEMTRSTDRAMANIESYPEGHRFLSKMFANEDDFLCNDNDLNDDDVNSVHCTSPKPNNEPLPNPWSSRK